MRVGTLLRHWAACWVRWYASSMSRLPAWVVDEETSVAEEAAPYIDMPDEERLRHLAAACRAGAKLLRLRDDAAAALDYEDPLPASTVHALARLRAAARGAPP